MFLDGLAIKGPTQPRKLGVTPAMLNWLGDRLHGTPVGGPVSAERRERLINDAVLWMTLCLAFFFCLRASEYCSTGKVDLKRILRGVDVRLEAEKVVVQFRLQKSDQRAFGMNRAQYSSGQRLCVVAAVQAVQRLLPERFGQGREAQLALCRWADGTCVTRDDVQAALQRAAEAKGLPASRFKTHSLRIGGASAIYNATGEIETVKRYGRWSSGAFHQYLWDADEQHRGLAAQMAEGEATLHYT